ncbi:hypothetical protein [Tropicimonas sp. IMCC34043]|uniref:hypothetical protein n=1 Tax=Tropicimonas sp. IMCC34043 TaxID=2248760 RepID=UPI001300605C|nr:hypothetical protein [Tropicimonas sp. IMCC34043]
MPAGFGQDRFALPDAPRDSGVSDLAYAETAFPFPAVLAIPSVVLWFGWNVLGGVLCAALIAVLLAITLGERRPLPIIALGALAGGVVELLFVKLLYARIPEGLLGAVF